MSDDAKVSRREVLMAGLGGAAGLVAGPFVAAAGPATGAAPVACSEATPAQIEGPFYPTRDADDEDVDLTQVRGRPGRAAGEVVHVRGRVLDERCQAVADALVEIWQANAAGRYDHERDAGNPRPLDPSFQSWAEVRTDAKGRFGFKTIKPGSYPADDSGWIRPPHIHFKVSRRGYHELITQMYFAGEPLNEPDRLLRALPPEERERVTVQFRAGGDGIEPGARLGVFDITLRKVSKQ